MKTLIRAATVLIVSTAQSAVVIHVDAGNCPGPGDGSALDPYCSIQTAIDNAVDTDEIVVAPGTYFESINFLGKAITVGSTDPQDPAVVGNTIIDGTGSFHVVQCVSGEGQDTVLDGFTITGGIAKGSYPDNRGGGMFNGGTSPTVTNCTFTGNSAFGGGGMYNAFDSGVTVTNCTFSENSASVGGGMSNIHSKVKVTNCTFTGNSASSGGGGMYTSGGMPVVADCSFCGNDPDAIVGGFVDGGSNSFVCPCPADLDGDGAVGINDFLELLAAWGPNSGHPADLDGDGIVGINDFLDLLAAWGPCP